MMLTWFGGFNIVNPTPDAFRTISTKLIVCHITSRHVVIIIIQSLYFGARYNYCDDRF